MAGAEHRECGGADEQFLGRRACERKFSAVCAVTGPVGPSTVTQPVVGVSALVNSPQLRRRDCGAEERGEAWRGDHNGVRSGAPTRPSACDGRRGVGARGQHDARPARDREHHGDGQRPPGYARPWARRKRAYRHRCPSATTARFADA